MELSRRFGLKPQSRLNNAATGCNQCLFPKFACFLNCSYRYNLRHLNHHTELCEDRDGQCCRCAVILLPNPLRFIRIKVYLGCSVTLIAVTVN
jgi:hypothetical protein